MELQNPGCWTLNASFKTIKVKPDCSHTEPEEMKNALQIENHRYPISSRNKDEIQLDMNASLADIKAPSKLIPFI